MRRFPLGQHTWIGAGFGAILATGLHLWHMHAAGAGMQAESAGLTFGLVGVFLGFPTSIPVLLLLDYMNGSADIIHYGVLLAIVANWAALLWLSGYFRDGRKRAHEAPRAPWP